MGSTFLVKSWELLCFIFPHASQHSMASRYKSPPLKEPFPHRTTPLWVLFSFSPSFQSTLFFPYLLNLQDMPPRNAPDRGAQRRGRASPLPLGGRSGDAGRGSQPSGLPAGKQWAYNVQNI